MCYTYFIYLDYRLEVMTVKLFEETVESQVLFRGRIVTLRQDVARLEDGTLAGREVVEHPGGVCVLALEEDNTVYTVRQFRYPFGQVVEELPAGKLDGPEDHCKAGLRELGEEIGAVPEEFIYLGALLASPGFCTERLHMYLARGLRFEAQHLDEGEFLEVRRTPFEELYERVMAGEITDAKTVACVLKVGEFLRREGKR